MGRKKNEVKVGPIEIFSSPEKDQGTPLRAVYCLKRKVNMRETEEREDCFILGFDPNDDLSHLSNKGLDSPNSTDVSVVAEKGQVACRDYPHSRHLCLKNRFETTPHESYCELCYCFVCDVAAPCPKWSGGNGHCHAIDNEAWKSQRRRTKRRNQ